MSERCRIELTGCTPEPLMSYLKALGVLRLVSDQADSEALGCWDRDVFVLESALDRTELETFFLKRYEPTPILGPWAGGSGFFGNDNRTAVEAIAASSVERLSGYRQAIATVRCILEGEGLAEKPSGDQKALLLRRYRREMPDKFIEWMDASMTLGQEREWFAPILGTGGNDGRLDFTQNFMQRIVDLELDEPVARNEGALLLKGCLWGFPTARLGESAVGQFCPGRAGGPNATQGMEAGSTDNPWDYLLALEGALMLSSAAVRRLKSGAGGRAAFPFTVSSRPVGNAGASEEEAQEARGELWLPLWHRKVSAAEARALFSEGRVEVGRKPVGDAVGFSRAVAALGTDRGIDAFSRYALFKRSGKSYLAVATERFAVPSAPRESVELIDQIDTWLDGMRSRIRSEGPARLQATVRRIESAIYIFCKHARREDLLEVLIACGDAERELAVTSGKVGDKLIVPPLQTLRRAWIEAVRDQSAEFEIALALASLHGVRRTVPESALPSIRANLEPVKRLARRRWGWDERAPSVVWATGGLTGNLERILSRRLLGDGGKRNLAFHHGVRLSTITKFLSREVDDRRIAELFWALALVDTKNVPKLYLEQETEEDLRPPRAYALLKPLFLPWALNFSREQRKWHYEWTTDNEPMKLEPRILPLLRADRAQEACEIAERRLLVSGVPPLRGAGSLGGSIDPARLAAALLLPVRDEDLDRLLQLVVYPPVPELQGA